MAETLLIDAAKEILSKVLSLVANEANLARGFKGELKRLAETLKMIQDLLSDAESKQLTLKAVKTWLKSLNAVAYDADTVLDEFSYELLRRQVAVRDRIEYKVRDLFSPSNNPLLFRLKMAHKIKAINLSLDDIFKEANKIGLKPVELINSSAGAGRQEVLATHPGLGDSEEIVGRAADVSVVADMLLMPNNENGLPVISIVGMGGQGKTTLAKQIYKNDKVVRLPLPVKTWLKSLNAVAYDADTVLDEFSYELLRRQVTVRDRIEYKVRDFFSAPNNPLLFRLKMAHKIKAINLSLDDIFKEANKIGLKPVELINSSAGAGRQEVLATHPGLGDSDEIVGRAADVSVVVGHAAKAKQ
ncbi:hypothetical protein RJ640_020189 [Escallonia rubra]|uniref:Uncharacterized protein n=1 Tax=Escallonia rubra TaxID=112253 RepID=A0AA88QVL0_9ASTE|nr:hypothetical protein RJ640_020189 [Escallonia rubra]